MRSVCVNVLGEPDSLSNALVRKRFTDNPMDETATHHQHHAQFVYPPANSNFRLTLVVIIFVCLSCACFHTYVVCVCLFVLHMCLVACVLLRTWIYVLPSTGLPTIS